MDLLYRRLNSQLSTKRSIADKIAIMYLGRIVEYGPAKKVFENPAHPYTNALFKAIPDENTNNDINSIIALEREVPSAINIPLGCRFHTRCPVTQEICYKEEPPVIKLSEEHEVACLLLRKNESGESLL